MSENDIESVAAGPESAICENELHYVEDNDRAFLVTRVDGELRAYRNLCTHQNLVMDDCRVSEGSFECPWHTVRYSLATGEVTDDSGFMGLSALDRYETEVREGQVYLLVPRSAR